MKLPERIKSIRKERGLTQLELGRAIGAEQSTIQRWETGARSPNIKQIYNIARALDVPASRLIENGTEGAQLNHDNHVNEALSMECLDELLKEARSLIKAGHPVEFVFDTIESIARIIAAPGAEPISRNEIHLRVDTAVRLHGAPVRPK